MGGFDIFKSKIEKDGAWSQPENLGFPINTTDNDKYFVVSKDGKRGYYHGIRPGGYGNQDIYIVHFDKPAPVAAAKTVFGQEKAEITDAGQETKNAQSTAKSHELVSVTGSLLTVGSLNRPLSKVKVKLTNESKELIGETTSDNKGNFNFEGVPDSRNYNLQLEINESELPYKVEPASIPISIGTAPDNSEAGKKTGSKSAAVQQNGGTGAGGLSIMKSAVCRNVLNLEPVDEGDKFPESAGKLWYYTVVNAGFGKEEMVSHIWYFNGNEVSRVALKAIGTGWRTYSSKTIWPGMAGDWKAEAITTDGKVLNSIVFKIER